MESGIRVKEIKKRFENLNSNRGERVQEQVKHPDRGNIKRTHAFRTPKNGFQDDSEALRKRLEAPKNGFLDDSVAFKKRLEAAKNDSEALKKRLEALKNGIQEDSDALKKRLEAPLPKGPAPQKPPRTFAHLQNVRPFLRCKTEPHIMLKKIESTLQSNQTILEPKKDLVQTINSHVYDTPVAAKRSQNCFPSFKNPCSTSEPLYTEPYIPKLPNGSNTRQPQTLHYLSSPIMIDSPQNGVKPMITLYEDSLKDIQIKMLEPFNNNTRSETDSDGDSVKDIKHVVEERKIYAKRVCSIKNVNYSNQNKSNLIDALLLIGIDSDVNNGHVAYIKSKYPTNSDVPDNFARLVFPDAENWTLTQIPDHIPKNAKHNNYTVFITSSDGSRSYAYCRRIQPEGSPVCLPLAYAILTSHRPNSFYYKILHVIESKHGMPKAEFNAFVNHLLGVVYTKKHEALILGESLLYQSVDERMESSNISTLLQTLNIPVFIQILSSLLLERKIILVGSFISVLSDCVEGLTKCLYPFEWQHTIISLLPLSMSEILEAPTPYIVGLLKNRKEAINSAFFSEVEDVIVVDVDHGTVIKRQGDEASIIPERLAKALKEALYLVPVHSTDVAPSEAIVRLFVELVGHYNNHLISTAPDKNKRFLKDNFIKSPASKSVRLYLEWFTETALFHHFIRERMERTNHLGLFEHRCAEHVEKTVAKEKGKTRGLKNFRDWGISS